MGNSLQKNSEEKKSEKPEGLICEICFEPTLKEGKGTNFRCSRHNFCTDCMVSHIRVEVEDKNLADVRCPGSDCRHLVNHLVFRNYLPAPVFLKWSDLLCEKALRGLQRCYCPNPGCSALIVNECGGEVRGWKCPSCQHAFCFDCKMPWHPGSSCDEQEEMMKDENYVLFGRLLEAKKWRRCPGCGEAIELLEGGCAQVSCRCGTRFCYRCVNLIPSCRCRAHFCQRCGSLIRECRCRPQYEPWMFLVDLCLGGPYMFFLTGMQRPAPKIKESIRNMK